MNVRQRVGWWFAKAAQWLVLTGAAIAKTDTAYRAIERESETYRLSIALDKVARLESAARLTLQAMEADPCDCMAHRIPPTRLQEALER